MDRRHFMAGAITTTFFIGAGGAFLLSDNQQTPSIDTALNDLDKLMAQKLVMSGEWDFSQVLEHCVQSVEYSMIGFPEHKSPLFKHTIGDLAFNVFSSRGEMTHSLSEPIPGAPLLVKSQNINNLYKRFSDVMRHFQNYDGELAEHFAYGKLTKQEYEKAHVMHFYNHMLEVNG